MPLGTSARLSVAVTADLFGVVVEGVEDAVVLPDAVAVSAGGFAEDAVFGELFEGTLGAWPADAEVVLEESGVGDGVGEELGEDFPGLGAPPGAVELFCGGVHVVGELVDEGFAGLCGEQGRVDEAFGDGSGVSVAECCECVEVTLGVGEEAGGYGHGDVPSDVFAAEHGLGECHAGALVAVDEGVDGFELGVRDGDAEEPGRSARSMKRVRSYMAWG